MVYFLLEKKSKLFINRFPDDINDDHLYRMIKERFKTNP